MSKPYDIGPVTVGNDMKSMNKSTDSTNYKCQNQSASITRYTSRLPVDFHGWCLKPVFFKFPFPKWNHSSAVLFDVFSEPISRLPTFEKRWRRHQVLPRCHWSKLNGTNPKEWEMRWTDLGIRIIFLGSIWKTFGVLQVVVSMISLFKYYIPLFGEMI